MHCSKEIQRSTAAHILQPAGGPGGRMRSFRTLITFGVGAAVAACGGSPDGGGRGAERDVPVVWIDGYQHRLVVKMSNGQQTVVAGGSVELADPARTDRLAEVAEAHGLVFAPLLRIDPDLVQRL